MKKTKQYVHIIGLLIKKIEKAKPKDRIEYAVATSFLLNALRGSIDGWMQWMTSLENINTLTMKQWKEVYPEMVKLSTNWLKVDLSLTKKKIAEATIKLKEAKKKLKKRTSNKSKKTTYVA